MVSNLCKEKDCFINTDALKCEPVPVGDLHFPGVHPEISGVSSCTPRLPGDIAGASAWSSHAHLFLQRWLQVPSNPPRQVLRPLGQPGTRPRLGLSGSFSEGGCSEAAVSLKPLGGPSQGWWQGSLIFMAYFQWTWMPTSLGYFLYFIEKPLNSSFYFK